MPLLSPLAPPYPVSQVVGGAKGESNGIIAIMELIKQDIEKDISKATANEDEAIKNYDKLCADIASTISSLDQSKADLEDKIASDETSMGTEKTTRETRPPWAPRRR